MSKTPQQLRAEILDLVREYHQAAFPMRPFDAAATPMFASFQEKPDLRTFAALPEKVDMTEKNLRTAWGAGLKMDFSREDAADDYLLNETVWKSVRGAASPMPAPIHAAFVFTRQSDDD